MHQAGLLSTINLIPLGLGGHMNIVADSFGLNPESFNCMHRWIGRVAVIEGVFHTILGIALGNIVWQHSKQIAAVIAASSMVLIILSSISLIRRCFYETFLKIHQILAAIIIASVCIHSSGSLTTAPLVYLLAAGCTWIFVRIVQFANSIYRSKIIGQSFSRAVIWTIPGALQIHVKVGRPWRYHAGQYVYLCIPGATYGSWMQSHPYFVSWWYKDQHGNDIVVFILECKKGFSLSLAAHSSGNLILNGNRIEEQFVIGLRSLVEGPYGSVTPLSEYGTVLLFANGIGIAAQLPYIKQFLQGYHDWDVKARKIALYWEVKSEGHLKWVGNWMTELLREDTQYILKIYIYVTGDFTTPGVQYGMSGKGGEHGRIDLEYKILDIDNIIKTELSVKRGRSMVLVCVKRSIGKQIRKAIRAMINRERQDIYLKELPFYPV
ncbi:uncharacterized protein EAF01_010139 [Botrytis porri]|uniref:uncharacterized protein n=1 Tax=Botrytis porri TaxID=87229 RepID=UPI0019000A96|nr:uncharacterized protein EAF01_010139 [Botrytis porri]KAF7894689.1 hypothetical protein EAF01_010139 [Botrytis porri]